MDKKMQDLLDLLFESNKQYNIFKDNIKQSLVILTIINKFFDAY